MSYKHSVYSGPLGYAVCDSILEKVASLKQTAESFSIATARQNLAVQNQAASAPAPQPLEARAAVMTMAIKSKTPAKSSSCTNQGVKTSCASVNQGFWKGASKEKQS